MTETDAKGQKGTTAKEPLSIYISDANDTVYLAEQVGWLEEWDGQQEFHPITCDGIHSKDDAIFRLTVEAGRG